MGSMRDKGSRPCGARAGRARHRGQAALDRLGEQAFDLVRYDFQMPEGNGVAVYRAVEKRAPPRPAAPLMTGHAEGSAYAEFLQTTRAAVLSKPVGLDDLRGHVRRMLEARSLR